MPSPRTDEAVLQLRVLQTPRTQAFINSALNDSGAAVNLIDGALVEELGIPTFPCVPSLRITAIDSQPIGEGYLKGQTELLEFQVGLFHHEQLAFYVTSSLADPMILGFPWLRCHDPQISWHTGELAHWSPTCLKECLREPVSRPCRTSCIEEATPVAQGHLPQPYADFWEVFSEERAARYQHISLTNTPAVFQALVNGVFQDLLGKGVIAYIDDILVYSASLEDHVRQVQEVLARLQRHHLYVRLEMCEFHRTTVTFLGSVSGPLTSLLRRKPKRLNWTDQAWVAFLQLKSCFTTAPILWHPDPNRPFVVEKLTAAEANYDVGNRELLAIKAALEEWRHWLEGARHPFQVLTDHRNLEYLRGAKRLNPRQARQFEAANESGQPDFILPSFILGPRQGNSAGPRRRATSCRLPTKQALRATAVPIAGYAVGARGTQLGSPRDLPIDPAHPPPVLVAFLGLGCGGVHPAMPHMRTGMDQPSAPEGLLVPLPVPRRPWSHLSVDFLTDLPDSGGFTAVMVVVDRFSKGCKLVPLKGLPTAMQTAEAMFSHVFRNFGLPEDIVSDRGPQFISQVWGLLCARLGIEVSLNSSHHPQSNGQAERLNQEIGRFLRTYCSREQQRWSEFLPWAENAQNSLTHSSMGLTPFQCVLVYQPPLFPWSGEPADVPAVEEWYRLSQEVWERAHVRLQRAVRRQRIQADRHRRSHQYGGAGGNWATVGRRSRGGRRVRRQREKRKGKGRELADVMERRKVDILCVQETRWKGSKACSIGAGFKLFYYGVDSKRNGVGVVLKEEFVRNVLEVGCELEEKERFWSELDEVMESIPTGERVVIGADFNGHVGEGNTGDEEVMGKFGVKERNLEGQMVVDFAKRMDMGVVNTYFQKREEHRVTYKSGGRRTQKKRQKLRQALGGQVVLPDDWETTAEVIRETGRKDSVQRKRLAKKKWDMDRTEENRQEYKELQRRVKREVSKAKQKAYEELYTRLDTREGEKDLYRVLTSEESVQRRWKEYFEELMNEENEREKRVEGVNSVEQKVDKIRKDEVRKALKRMKSGKAVGPDDIPVEVWKCLGEAAVEFLANLFNRVLENLEKAYDRVPREELWYCMRKSGVAEKYVRVVQDMYERSRTVVRCAVVMDQLSEEVRQESPWTMMFADDIVICSESREQVEENLERWRFALERRGMKVSRSKTEYMCVNEREGSGTVRLQGEEVKKVQEFKYLGSTVQSNGECGKEVKKRVQAGWNGWRKVSGVLCDRKISARIKGKVYRTVVRPAMLYGLETVSMRKRQESELEVAELKMLRGWACPLVPVKGTLNASAYQDILDNFMLPTLWEQFGDDPFLFQHYCAPVHKKEPTPGVSLEHILKHLLETIIHQQAASQEVAQSLALANKELQELRRGPHTTAVPFPEPGHAAQSLIMKMMAEDDVEAFLETFKWMAEREGWRQWDWADLVAPLLTGDS
ncbi:hypothetical protein QTP70_012033 [Hemibagrus guttatus]|uniref:Reverse transcriptase n=1 Tax=Hemibagrus guttatus TaxID=175788 RepID=A0AAE0R200_9TELE|nr:hypothetical protein QTP70_012033 [Hemibagrus guttatus]